MAPPRGPQHSGECIVEVRLPDATQTKAAGEAAAVPPPPAQQQPRWLAALRGEVDGLAAYVEALAEQRAREEAEAEKLLLAGRLKEAEARLLRQEVELGELRGSLSAATAATAAAASSGKPAGANASAAAAALVLEHEARVWRARCQQERQLRAVSEAAMKELSGVIDELLLRCDAISARFQQLSAATPLEATDKRRRPWGRHRQAVDARSLVADAALVLLLVGAAVGITIAVTRQVLLSGRVP